MIFVYPATQVSIPGAATEATLLLVEQNTANTVTELQTLNATDFATETTLTGAAASLTSIAAEDFATETTLAALAAIDFATESTLSSVATEATLASIDSKISNVNTDSVTVTSSALPTGAATEATLSALASEDFATENTLAALNSKVTAVDTDAVTVTSSVLPTGAATEATLATLATEATLAAVATEATLQNVATEATLQILTNKDVEHAIYVDYSVSNLPGNASSPLQLIASTNNQIRSITVFDTSGVPCEIMVGPAASEVRRVVFGPGADTTISVQITAGTRVSIRRLDAAGAVSVGDLTINFIS